MAARLTLDPLVPYSPKCPEGGFSEDVAQKASGVRPPFIPDSSPGCITRGVGRGGYATFAFPPRPFLCFLPFEHLMHERPRTGVLRS
jgi:hypothetical protein